MTGAEAKTILLLYRPGTNDGADPEMAQALEVARRDAELGEWFKRHCEFQQAMRSALRQVPAPAPAQLLKALSAGREQPRTAARPGLVEWAAGLWRNAWRNPIGIGAAVAVVVAAAAILGLLRFKPAVPDRFRDFQEQMVSAVLREYRMDIVTNDMREVRRYLAAQGAPADYQVTPGLENLKLTGAGRLLWRGSRVSMICFNRGDDQMLYLFALKRPGLEDLPPKAPQVSTVHDLTTVSWTHGDIAYVLAGPPEAGFLKKYL